MSTLLKTYDFLIAERNNRIEIRKRSISGFIFFIITLCFGLLVLLLRHFDIISKTSFYGMLFYAMGIFFLASAALFVFIMIKDLFSKGVVFDGNKCIAQIFGNKYYFNQIKSIRVRGFEVEDVDFDVMNLIGHVDLKKFFTKEPGDTTVKVPLSSNPIQMVYAEIKDRKPLLLFSTLYRHRESVFNAAYRIARLLSEAKGDSEPLLEKNREEDRKFSLDMERDFAGMMFILAGLMFTPICYFVFGDYTYEFLGRKLLVWPLGICIFAAGILQILKFPILRWARKGPWWKEVLFLLALLIPYYIFAGR